MLLRCGARFRQRAYGRAATKFAKRTQWSNWSAKCSHRNTNTQANTAEQRNFFNRRPLMYVASAAAFASFLLFVNNYKLLAEEDGTTEEPERRKYPKWRPRAHPMEDLPEDFDDFDLLERSARRFHEFNYITAWQGTTPLDPGGFVRGFLQTFWHILTVWFPLRFEPGQENNRNIWLPSTEMHEKWLQDEEGVKFLPEWNESFEDGEEIREQPPITVVFEMRVFLTAAPYLDPAGEPIVLKRPGTDYFLKQAHDNAELVLWTALRNNSAMSTLLKQDLDPYGFIEWRLFEDTTYDYWAPKTPSKTLSFLNRDLASIIVIDEHDAHYDCKENVLLLPAWKGDENDMTLIELVDFIETLSKVRKEKGVDVRAVLYQMRKEKIDFTEIFRTKVPHSEPQEYRKPLIHVVG